MNREYVGRHRDGRRLPDTTVYVGKHRREVTS